MPVFKKLIENGVIWFVNRSLREIKSPTYKLTKSVINKIHRIRKSMVSYKLLNKENFNSDDELVAVYDLRYMAITYDFVFFIVSAEAFMLKNNKKHMVIYFVKNEKNIVEDKEYEKTINAESVRWRFKNILLPVVSSYGKCSGYSVVANKDIHSLLKGRLVYPDLYDGKYYTPAMDYSVVFNLLNNYNFSGIEAEPQGVKYIDLWMKERDYCIDKVVAITIRLYGYDETRNSNIDSWVKFSKWIEKRGFIPIFILDTDTSFLLDDRFDDRVVFREICWNLDLRVALYEMVYLNFVTAGPAAVAQLNKNSNYIAMKFLSEDSLQATEKVYKSHGMSTSDNKYKYEFSNKKQILSFKDDSLENIIEEFKLFLKL